MFIFNNNVPGVQARVGRERERVEGIVSEREEVTERERGAYLEGALHLRDERQAPQEHDSRFHPVTEPEKKNCFGGDSE